MSIEQSRSRREVEDRQRDGRKGQRACDPREDGQHPEPSGRIALGAEQRTAAADGAERQRQHAQPGGQVVAAHQQQDERRAGEDRHLHDHPEMPPRPAVGCPSQSAGRSSVGSRGGPSSRRRIAHSTAPADARRGSSSRHSSSRCARPSVRLETASSNACTPCRRSPIGAMLRAAARSPGARCRRSSAAGLPGATRTISAADREVLAMSGGRALSGRCAVGSPARSRACAGRPEIWPHERDLKDGVDDARARRRR